MSTASDGMLQRVIIICCCLHWWIIKFVFGTHEKVEVVRKVSHVILKQLKIPNGVTVGHKCWVVVMTKLQDCLMWKQLFETFIVVYKQSCKCTTSLYIMKILSKRQVIRWGKHNKVESIILYTQVWFGTLKFVCVWLRVGGGSSSCISTLYTLTSVCIFSILFSICFLRGSQGEFG